MVRYQHTLYVLSCHFNSTSDNESVRQEFENYRQEDCDLTFYSYCQGGELMLQRWDNIDFDDGMVLLMDIS